MKQCNVTNREFHLALQWSTKSRQINVILTRTLPYSNNNYSDNLDNENGSKRLIRMLSVPRVVALQRAVAINKGPMMIKLMTILTITTNKSLKINWFEIRTKGGAKAGQYQMMKIKLMTIFTMTTRVATNKSLTRLIGLRFVPREVAGTPWSVTYNVCHSSTDPHFMVMSVM